MKTLQLTLCITLFTALLLMQSCTKQSTTTDSTLYSLSRITSHYFGGFADTTDYYNVSYSGSEVSKLTGKWGDIYNINRFAPSGFNRQSAVLLDSCTYDNAGNKLLWATKWYNGSPLNVTQLSYPTGTSSEIAYRYQATIRNRARITYNSDGDIASIGYYNGNPDTLLFTLNVSYNITTNRLQEFYKDFTLIDPFSNAHEIDKQTGKGFPVNIHYGKKCIAAFDVINSNGAHQLHNVSYQFNNSGYITKILIDGKPFMSYDYVPR